MNIKLLKIYSYFYGNCHNIWNYNIMDLIYSRFKNIYQSDIKTLSIKAPKNMNYIDHEIKRKKIFCILP